MKYTLETLPLGSVIEYRKKRYYKCAGMQGDILICENKHGVWYFINHRNYTSVNWKTFKVLFIPNETRTQI
jgi:hypothetical protein